MFKEILVLTDNLALKKMFERCVNTLNLLAPSYTYRYSPNNRAFRNAFSSSPDFLPLDVSNNEITSRHDLIISLHCKQLFPSELVKAIRCINIHPGFNPFNRGWFPQVFSIINKNPLGATIHEIDELLDHGPIIAQKQVPLFVWDTSNTAYERVLQAEEELLLDNLADIVHDSYKRAYATSDGNLNLKKDFDRLCEIDLNRVGRFSEFYDLLRALSHPPFKNAYFTSETGERIFLRLEVERSTAIRS
jgi:methionyl-tRNA formyltransferase